MSGRADASGAGRAGSCLVFISYAAEDKAMANCVCEALEAAGLRCWIAPRDVPPGGSYAREIMLALEKSDTVLLVLSDHANQSEMVAREIERAVSKKKTVIPTRLQAVPPEGALEFLVSGSQWIDLFPTPIESHLQHLVKSIRGSTDPTPELCVDIDRADAIESVAAGPAASTVSQRRNQLPIVAWGLVTGTVVATVALVLSRQPDTMNHSPPASDRAEEDVADVPAAATAIPGLGQSSATEQTVLVRIVALEGPAEVFLDGKFKGKTPYEFRGIAGTHIEIRLRRPGYVDYKDRITVLPQAKTWTIPMQRGPSSAF